MRKRFAPLALLFGLLTALMLGSTAVAQATTPLPTLAECTNSGVVNIGNVVSCNDTLHTVTVKIKNNKVLNNNELNILENALNNANIDLDILNVAKNQVLNVYNNSIDPDIIIIAPVTVDDVVTICLALICK